MTFLFVLAVIGGAAVAVMVAATAFHVFVCLLDVWLSWLGKRMRWLQ